MALALVWLYEAPLIRRFDVGNLNFFNPLQDFLKFILSAKQNFIPVKVNGSFVKMTQHLVLEMLNLKGLNCLRDKFEGVAFYERVSNFLFGLTVLEQHLGQSLINLKKVKQKDFSSNLSLVNLDINVVTFKMGYLPIIEVNNTSPTIFVLRRNDKSGWICGFAVCDILNAPINQKRTPHIGKDGEGKVFFTGFNQLKKFNDLEELNLFLIKDGFAVGAD